MIHHKQTQYYHRAINEILLKYNFFLQSNKNKNKKCKCSGTLAFKSQRVRYQSN